MLREKLYDHLHPYGQEHVLRWWDALSPAQKDGLAAQVLSLDLALIDREKHGKPSESIGELLAKFEQPPVVKPSGSAEDASAKTTGEQMLQSGEVALVLVAGGLGTRLKFAGPKGCFPITPIKRKTLFDLHAEKITALKRRYGASLPLYVMTSDATDDATRSFFLQRDNLGLGADGVCFFKQDNMPVVDVNWKLLMSSKDSIAMSPDGHGGAIQALRKSGAIDDMRQRGITDVFYFQVDNVLVQIADPLFLGYHRLKGAEMSLKVLEKRDPEENLGTAGRFRGRLRVVEYSDLTREQQHEPDPSGMLKYRMGSIAIHAFTVDFLARMSEPPRSLPLHRASKDVPYVDENGLKREPEGENNGIKFERFIFDALPEAKNALLFQTSRERDFSPVKNPEGEDSPMTARRSLVELHAAWLADAGVQLPRDDKGNVAVTVEISPLFALDAEEVKSRLADGFWLDSRSLDETDMGICTQSKNSKRS